MATSYANPGGTGDRLALITTTTTATLGDGSIIRLVDGIKAVNNNSGACWFNAGQSTRRITFYFNGLFKIIDEVIWTQQNGSTHGDWKFQGGNDNSSWTDIGSSFTLGGAGVNTLTSMAGNIGSWKYYSMLQVSGSTSSSPWLQEAEFKIEAGVALAARSFAGNSIMGA